MELAWKGQGLGWARLFSKCQVLPLVFSGGLEYPACVRTQEQKALVCLPAGREPGGLCSDGGRGNRMS